MTERRSEAVRERFRMARACAMRGPAAFHRKIAGCLRCLQRRPGHTGTVRHSCFRRLHCDAMSDERVPPEQKQTFRDALYHALQNGPETIRELSIRVGAREKDLLHHL